MQKAQVMPDKQKRRLPAWGGWLIAYAAVLIFAVGLVYFWRVAFTLTGLPAVPATLGVAGILSILYALVFCVWRFCRRDVCLQATVLLLVLGILFCFFTAPLQVPDEERHFLRAYAISMGRFDYDYSRGYPEDVDLLLENFPAAMNFSVRYEGGQLAPAHIAEYKMAVESGTAPTVRNAEPIAYMVLSYLPQALGIALARLFGLGALGGMYAARLCNLLFYAAVCYFAFKNCDRYRGVFFGMALLPLSLFLAASCSPDAIMLALCFLAASYFCKAEICTRDVWIFGVALAWATYIKVLNILLLAVLLLVPRERWRTKYKTWLAIAVILVSALVIYQGVGMFNGMRAHNYPAELPRGVGEGADTGLQTMFLLQNPLRFMAVAGLTLYEEAGFLFNLGTFGWLDMSIPLVSGLSVLSLCIAAALGVRRSDGIPKSRAWGLIATSLAYCAAVMVGLYISHTDVGSIRITGLQPRYFLPAFLLLFLAGGMLLGRIMRPRSRPEGAAAAALGRERATLCIVAAVAFLAAVLICQNYFVGQWVPKSEGGWKLINLFGWIFL